MNGNGRSFGSAMALLAKEPVGGRSQRQEPTVERIAALRVIESLIAEEHRERYHDTVDALADAVSTI
jgi:hypothetical protein